MIKDRIEQRQHRIEIKQRKDRIEQRQNKQNRDRVE